MPHKVADPIFQFNAPGPKPNGLQAADDGLWIIDQGDNHVYKVDWSTGEVLHDIPTETEHSSGITLGGGYVWVASTYSCEIFQIEIDTGKTIEKYPSPGAGSTQHVNILTQKQGGNPKRQVIMVWNGKTETYTSPHHPRNMSM